MGEQLNEEAQTTYRDVLTMMAPDLAASVYCPLGEFHTWQRRGFLRRRYCVLCGVRRG